VGHDRQVASVISEELANLLNVRKNSALILLIGVVLAFAGPVSCGHAASEQKASYGTRVKYRPGEKIDFPDFTVEYVGERRKTVPVYPRGFLYYDFKVSKGKTEKVISWTTGTGIIDPTDFEFDGKSYHLELRRSEKLGKLKDNELVIWQGNFRSR
jgi:signal peptidase I